MSPPTSTTAESELARLEAIIDASATAGRIEALLPVGVRPRQLQVRTLLIGMLLVAVHGRPAHLVRVHQALLELSETDQQQLAVITHWRTGPHTLTYRQLERTFGLVTGVLSKPVPDGTPSQTLSEVLDALLEASVQILGEPDSSSYAVDWSDLEAWSRPPRKPRPNPEDTNTNSTDSTNTDSTDTDSTDTNTDIDSSSSSSSDSSSSSSSGGGGGDDGVRRCTDPEAAWGHRNSNHPARNETFYGYYLQAITSVRDEHGPEIPELARRMQLASCDHDPPAQIVPVIKRMTHQQIKITDLLADSGYAYRVPETWALPLRALGIALVQDLHPADRGTNGTHQGTVCHNGNLYCPATPKKLLEHSTPLARGSSLEQTLTQDQKCAELARYKLSPISSYDPDGYRRVKCPAAQGKLRCPHRPASMQLPYTRPTIQNPPELPPACCTQQTITVPPTVNAKTAQKHDYPSAAHRSSYQRRTAAERTFAQINDHASNTLTRGNHRTTGLTAIALFTATTIIARNIRIHDAFSARQADNQRRASLGLAPKQRKHRHHTPPNPITASTPP